jgi:hypothetical protein
MGIAAATGTACGTGAGAGGEWLPATGKPPPDVPSSAGLAAVDLRAGFAPASFSALAKVGPFPLALAGSTPLAPWAAGPTALRAVLPAAVPGALADAEGRTVMR